MVVVVHVHVRERRSSLGEKLDEFFHHQRLDLQVVRPSTVVAPLADAIAIPKSTEKEEIVLGAPKGMAFEIKEDVTIVRSRQEFKTVSEDRVLGGRHEFILRRPRMSTGRDLESGLADQSLEVLIANIRHWSSAG